jgi:CRP-like cAMP-binding protein
MNAAVREDVFLPCLEGLSLFENVGDELKRFIISGSTLVSHSRGEILCEKGGMPDGIHCLLSGKLKLALLSQQGNERVVEIIEPGGMYGEALVFHEQASLVYVQALANSKLVVLRKAYVREAVRRFPDFALAMLECMAARMHRLVQDVEVCCLQSAVMRVAGFLVEHATKCGSRLDARDVELPACKAVVASSLNLTPETFSRELHRLAGQGLISVERRNIRIHDIAGLRSLMAL